MVTNNGYSVQHRYVHGPGVDQPLIDEVTGGTNVWLVADRSGSITLMVPFDFTQSGSDPIYYQSYSAFGELQLDLPEDFEFRFGYTAREWDAETELNYHRARYYDPSQGRFISQDPLGLDAGDVNLYRYVSNSPLNYVDPSGLRSAGVYNGVTQASTWTWWDSSKAFLGAFPGAVVDTFSSGQAFDSAQGAVTAGLDATARGATFGFVDPGLRETAALFGNEDAKQAGFAVGEGTVTTMEMVSLAHLGKNLATKGIQAFVRNADEVVTPRGANVLGQVDNVALQRLQLGAQIEVPAGTQGIRTMMSDLSVVSGNEVALLRTESGRRIMVMGGPNTVSLPAHTARVIAHTHPRASAYKWI